MVANLLFAPHAFHLFQREGEFLNHILTDSGRRQEDDILPVMINGVVQFTVGLEGERIEGVSFKGFVLVVKLGLMGGGEFSL